MHINMFRATPEALGIVVQHFPASLTREFSTLTLALEGSQIVLFIRSIEDAMAIGEKIVAAAAKELAGEVE